MSVIKSGDTGEFILDNDFELNRVNLKVSEKEHTHQFVELVYTLSGKGIHEINGKPYCVKGGDMLIINYHCRHAITPVENLKYIDIMLKPQYVNDTLTGTEDLFLLLSLNDFSDLSNRIIKENILIHFDGEDKTKIETLLLWIQNEQKNPAPAGRLMIHSGLSMLLCTVFRKMTENQSSRLSINDRLLSYIERNCGNKLLINELAAMCGYTTEHFSRIFRKYTSKTPLEFVTECRIKRAMELLLKTDKSVEVIMSECGFANRTAFFKKFSSHVGTTPLQFRKSQK